MDSPVEKRRSASLRKMDTKEEGTILNADDLKLAEMGYKPVPILIPTRH
jgi:hypothetical protein